MSLYELEMPLHTVVAQKMKQSPKHTTGTTAASSSLEGVVHH